MNSEQKTYYTALGIVVMVALAVLSGKIDLIFRWAFWVVLGFGGIYLLMRMWKNVNKPKKEDEKDGKQ